MKFLYYLCRKFIMAENREIERKFLVKDRSFVEQASAVHQIAQGYLCREPERTIRVRIRDERAFLTIKSNIGQQGITRFEWEKEIDPKDARELLSICQPEIIEKKRYIVKANGEWREARGERKWEVDVFEGRLKGVVIAEIELGSEEEPFERPDWLGEEVTQQKEYTNSILSDPKLNINQLKKLEP